MSPDDQLLASIQTIIERVTGPNRTPVQCGRDTPLADGFWLDSIELLEVIVACESEFGILFDETSPFESGAWGTLGSLTDLVRSRQLTQRSGSWADEL